jgi:hypothetical protein
MGENGHKDLTAIKRNVNGFLHSKSTLNGRNPQGSLKWALMGKHILCLWKENACLMSCVLKSNLQIGCDADGQFGQVHRTVEFVGAKADSFKFLDFSRCFNQAVLTLKMSHL